MCACVRAGTKLLAQAAYDHIEIQELGTIDQSWKMMQDNMSGLKSRLATHEFSDSIGVSGDVVIMGTFRFKLFYVLLSGSQILERVTCACVHVA